MFVGTWKTFGQLCTFASLFVLGNAIVQGDINSFFTGLAIFIFGVACWWYNSRRVKGGLFTQYTCGNCGTDFYGRSSYCPECRCSLSYD